MKACFAVKTNPSKSQSTKRIGTFASQGIQKVAMGHKLLIHRDETIKPLHISDIKPTFAPTINRIIYALILFR